MKRKIPRWLIVIGVAVYYVVVAGPPIVALLNHLLDWRLPKGLIWGSPILLLFLIAVPSGGAGIIFGIVRLINRRDDPHPRRKNRGPDPWLVSTRRIRR